VFSLKGLKSGTTTVGIVYKDGVILAAERKATMGYLVASKEDLKIVEIMPHIAITQAGMVGDIQALTRYLIAESKLYELRTRKRIPVKAAATLLANILYGGRWSFFPYMVQLILAGYDETGSNLFILHPDGSILERRNSFPPVQVLQLLLEYSKPYTKKVSQSMNVKNSRLGQLELQSKEI
jgi:proteasome beta subunit